MFFRAKKEKSLLKKLKILRKKNLDDVKYYVRKINDIAADGGFSNFDKLLEYSMKIWFINRENIDIDNILDKREEPSEKSNSTYSILTRL